MPTYRIYDAKIWLDRADKEQIDLLPLWHRSLNLLASHGWTITKDPQIEKHYRTLSPTHRIGRQGDLHVVLVCHRNQLDFEFWQDIVIEPGRTNGGRYSFNQRQLMPYLIRLQWQKTVQQLVRFWEEQGITRDASNLIDETPMVGMAALRKQMRDWKWHLPKSYDPFTFTSEYSYNVTSADGQRIQPGQWYAFYHRRRLYRGQAFYGMNNNLWMLMNERTRPVCVHTAHIWTWKPGLPRREPLPLHEQITKAEDRLSRLVKQQAFEKCIRARDHLRQLKAAA